MKWFLFPAAVFALVASAGAADAQPTPAPAPAPAPVITTGAPVMESVPAQSSRRGLFGRLRSRNSGATTYSTPLTTTPAMTAPAPSATPTPMPPSSTPTPMPMPGTGTSRSTAMPMTGIIVQASGNIPAGTYTTTDGTIIQIGGTQPTMEPMTSQSGRRGLFGRSRNR